MGLVCRKGFGDFFLKTGLVDQVFEIQKGNSASYKSIITHLNKYAGVDNLISPHESLRTMFFCAKIKANNKISFDKKWNLLFFSKRQKKNRVLPDALRQLSLLSYEDPQLAKDLSDFAKHEDPYLPRQHGHLSAPPLWASMSLRHKILQNQNAFAELKEKLKLDNFDRKPVVLLFPGSVWATKRWTEEGFIACGKALQQKGFQVCVMGAKGEEALAERVAASVPGSFCLAGKTSIFESAQIIAHSALVIGNDSASAHLAAACETPLIAIFGPTVLEFGYRPWSAQSYVVQNSKLACRPCGKHGHHECPRKTHECMKSISAEEVLQTAGFILRS